jgi:NADPH-dependent ferric siderophore reductase
MMSNIATSRHQITRVHRETRRRLLTVAGVERITPRMQRIRFVSPDLHDFDSAAPDDHVKLFLPTSSEQDGGVEGICVRDYTPRRFDPEMGTLTIDFAVHQAGPATSWALGARAGDTLEIGGPRKSNVVADDFDWYLLIGDETALPSIGRRVEELRPGVLVLTFVVVENLSERQTFATSVDWQPYWIARAGQDDETLLGLALSDHRPPPGDGYIWIAAEAQAARSLRTFVTESWGHPKEWIKGSGYWVRGKAGAHE